MLGRAQQRLTHRGIALESFRAVDQPQIQRVLRGPYVRHQLRVVAFRIVHQITRMHFEKSSQQHPCGIGQMRPRATLDLREIRLADRASLFFLESLNHLKLRHLPPQAAQHALHLAEVPDFFS